MPDVKLGMVSIVIRTYNEERHLPELLGGIANQNISGIDIETVIVDSGSTDSTLSIAEENNCRIINIKKTEFTFGRSLNMGCGFSRGEYLAFISGHCIPIENDWLQCLLDPLREKKVQYAYGRHVGRDETKFSETRAFEKYFPKESSIPQEGFFCNNANAAILRSTWEKMPFDEDLTGLEDMHLAQRLVEQGGKVAYVAEAAAYHIHDESWEKVRLRFEREAIALQKIMPEIHLNLLDSFRYFTHGVWHDVVAAQKEGLLRSSMIEILMFRLMQYWGSYKGNHDHRLLSKQNKEKYFYPNN